MELWQDLMLPLTPKQREYCRLLICGIDAKQAQYMLGLATPTMETTWKHDEDFQRVVDKILANTPHYKSQMEQVRDSLILEWEYRMAEKAAQWDKLDFKTQRLVNDAMKFISGKKKSESKRVKNYEDKLSVKDRAN